MRDAERVSVFMPIAGSPTKRRLLDMAGRDAEIFPYHLDLASDRLMLAHLPLKIQEQASFLDERALSPDSVLEWTAWTDFEHAVAPAPRFAPAYLLHLGHSGSTLISRLFQAATSIRSLREPLPLRTLAFDAAHGLDGCALLTRRDRIERLRSLESGWACNAPALIKATSMVNDMADDIAPDSAVIFLYLRPEIFIASLLATPQRQIDLRNFGQMRLRRWNNRSSHPHCMTELGPGELAALCWLVEASSIAAATREIHALDFDDFLADAKTGLSDLCARVNAPMPSGGVDQAFASGIMQRHSKSPDTAFDAATRTKILQETRERMKDEITNGLNWLEKTAPRFKAGEVAMDRFALTL